MMQSNLAGKGEGFVLSIFRKLMKEVGRLAAEDAEGIRHEAQAQMRRKEFAQRNEQRRAEMTSRFEKKRSAANDPDSRRGRHAAAVVERRKTERVYSADMPFSHDEMVSMVLHIRPGMSIADLGSIEVQSLGILNAELLTGERAWGKAYDARQPCIIAVSKKGIIEGVTFPAYKCDPEGVAGFASAQDLLDTRTDARRVKEREVYREQFTIVGLADHQDGYSIFLRFYSGKLFATHYETTALYQREVRKVKKRSQKIMGQCGEVAEPETINVPLDADAALRHAMQGVVDRTGDSTYSEIAEWLIKSTPEDRHILLGFNWDHGYEIPLWIIRQPDTHLATALKAFWMGGAARQLTKTPPKGTSADAVTFAQELNERLKADFYFRGTAKTAIGYDPREFLPRQKEALDGLRRICAPAAFDMIEGQSEYQLRDRFPAEWWDYLN